MMSQPPFFLRGVSFFFPLSSSVSTFSKGGYFDTGFLTGPVHSSSPASTKPPTATASPPPTAPTAPKSMTSLPQGGGGGKKKKRKKGKRYMDRDANGGDLGAGIMDD